MITYQASYFFSVVIQIEVISVMKKTNFIGCLNFFQKGNQIKCHIYDREVSPVLLKV